MFECFNFAMQLHPEPMMPLGSSSRERSQGFPVGPNPSWLGAVARITMKELVNHFCEHEQVDQGEEGRAYSTRAAGNRFGCAKLMSYYIQPIAKKQGITKQIGWNTFPRTYTTLLHANGEDVKVVQKLLHHGSAEITMDAYAQAVTQAKGKAQEKVVAMLRDRHDF